MRTVLSIRWLLFTLGMLLVSVASSAQVRVGAAVTIAPPELPVYEQPICPAAGYLWTPGYWAYGDDGYFWVPGTWVLAPRVGFLWTPGYWGWGAVGFVGGRWNGGVFAYNTAVMHVNTTVIHTTYIDRTVVNNVTVNNHVSFNGGTGGVVAQPNAAERAAANEHHVAPTAMQTQHEHAASTNRALLASENHGKPAIAATTKPGEFNHGVVAAGAPHNGSPNGGNKPPSNAANVQKSDRPPSSTGGAGSNGSHTNTANTTNASHAN